MKTTGTYKGTGKLHQARNLPVRILDLESTVVHAPVCTSTRSETNCLYRRKPCLEKTSSIRRYTKLLIFARWLLKARLLLELSNENLTHQITPFCSSLLPRSMILFLTSLDTHSLTLTLNHMFGEKKIGPCCVY